MRPELQIRIFGYVDPVQPLPDSWKGQVYAAAEQGLTNDQIERLADTSRRMQARIETKIVAPILRDESNEV